jgi:hypothetical protein
MLAIVPPRLFLWQNKLNTIALINQTTIQYDEIISKCKSIFEKKNHDYGPSWRIMRVSSIIDQIFIKATRIRTLEEKGTQMIAEGVESEWMGIINYCIMALIQLTKEEEGKNLAEKDLVELYEKKVVETKNLMLQKNHDYGEIWRSMLVSTFTDMLLMRVNRMHQILSNDGKTLASEGVESNLMDMINYSVFALIQINTKEKISKK